MSIEYSLVALDTYGKEMVFDPSSRQRFSALKCTHAVPDILVMLFPDLTRDLTPVRSMSYRYILLDPMPTLKKNYLVLRLTQPELMKVETICRQQAFPWVYLWRNGKWLEFPSRDYAEYRPVHSGSSSSYPRFPATSATWYSPQNAGEKPTSPTSDGVTIEQSGDWWWIGGNTYSHRHLFKALGAHWSKQRQQWYYRGITLPQSIQTLVNQSPAEDTPPIAEPAPTSAPTLKPVAGPIIEEVSNRDVSAVPIPPKIEVSIPTAPQSESLPAKSADLLRALPLKYIGHVSIVGDCFCFGLAVEYTQETHRLYPIYLNIAGAATSVEAAWARLAQGKELSVSPLQKHATPIYMYPPEKGLYHRLQRKIDGLGMDNLILAHKSLTQPNFAEDKLAFLIALDYHGACLRLADFVSKTVKVAVFPAWGHYLRQQGYLTGLLTPRTSFEGVEFWTIKLEAVTWTTLICEGLRKGVIHLP